MGKPASQGEEQRAVPHPAEFLNGRERPSRLGPWPRSVSASVLSLLYISLFPLAALLCSSTSCAPRITAPHSAGHDGTQPPFKPTVDFSPVWSHSGGFIAFRRAFPSTDGPPGVYVVSAFGGRPRLAATPADVFWPRNLRYSPDDRYLVGISASQLMVISISTGAVNIPSYTDNSPDYPDWSPAGSVIAYSRMSLSRYPPEPPDSAGLHLLDVATGDDHAIYRNGQVVVGRELRWSPDGEWIAYIDPSDLSGERIALISPEGSRLRILYQASAHQMLRDLRWYRRMMTGEDGVLFTIHGIGTYFADVRTGSVRPWVRMRAYTEFSDDGLRMVFIGSAVSDSLGVLYTQDVDDYSGTTIRQLTSYVAAAGAGVDVAMLDFVRTGMTHHRRGGILR